MLISGSIYLSFRSKLLTKRSYLPVSLMDPNVTRRFSASWTSFCRFCRCCRRFSSFSLCSIWAFSGMSAGGRSVSVKQFNNISSPYKRKSFILQYSILLKPKLRWTLISQFELGFFPYQQREVLKIFNSE